MSTGVLHNLMCHPVHVLMRLASYHFYPHRSEMAVVRETESVATSSPDVELHPFLIPQLHHRRDHNHLHLRQPQVTICSPETMLQSSEQREPEGGMVVRIEEDEDEDLLVTDFVVSV